MIEAREYGSAGPRVVLLHGGPGAPGYLAPVARALADEFRVLEPLQRGAGGDPLTVRRHVDDLEELLAARGTGERLALVGHSWGAMLALAHGAVYTQRAAQLMLIGCGTFTIAARERMQAIREQRTNERLRRRFEQLEQPGARIADGDQRLAARGNLLARIDSYDLLREAPETSPPHVSFDARAHEEAWQDMLRLQAAGVYPAAFAAIRAPVFMLHGAEDPHPGPMIRESLAPFLPQLEYVELTRCGHYPWRERYARERFFELLRAWLGRL